MVEFKISSLPKGAVDRPEWVTNRLLKEGRVVKLDNGLDAKLKF